MAIIRRDNRYVAIRRNDGYGLGLPGGVARPFESAENALRREVHEETGLTVTSAELKLVFETSLLYPTRTSVFEATVEGDPQGSWEGQVVSVSLAELEQGIMKTQMPVVEYLKRNNYQ